MSGYAQPGSPWIVASHAEGRPVTLDGPYPCRCEDVDTDPPQWKRERALRSGAKIVYRCDPYLHKTSSTWRNRCPCWGRVRDDYLPEGCCANHEQSPRYSVRVEGLLLDPFAVLEPVTSAVLPAEVVDVELPPPDDEDVELGLRYSDETGDVAIVRMPYIPRWTAAERTCECPTPWDGDKRPGGYHCVACHVNWSNVGVAGLHQRSVLDPCKPPASIVDCELGTPILRMRMEGVHVVWG